MTTDKSVQQIIENRSDQYVKVGVVDIDGVLRGKYISTSKLRSAAEGGFGFCDVVLGWDVADRLYDNSTFTGWHSGFPDASVRIIPDSIRELPNEAGVPFLLCEFAGDAEALCPRGVLRRVLERAKRMGFDVQAGFEYEFFVFDETPASLREKNYLGLTPLSPGAFGYSVLRSSEQSGLYRALLDGCALAGITLEGLHEETGAGVLEAAITVDAALAAADKAVLFKHCAKLIARSENKVATFMAKCSMEWPGQSGHIHISLTGKNGASVFHDAGIAGNISDGMRHFIGGQQELMPEFLAMVAPTVNSFTRLVPGYWAPTSATWGIENRTCALRAIPGSPSSQRVEYRVASADANPYLALAAAVASGLWGIKHAIEPDEPVTGNAYERTPADQRCLPATLWDAAQRLKQSSAARDSFGDSFVEHFAGSREWEEREFRKHVTDWELQRYFEII